jgi:hypothetical protein
VRTHADLPAHVAIPSQSGYAVYDQSQGGRMNLETRHELALEVVHH